MYERIAVAVQLDHIRQVVWMHRGRLPKNQNTLCRSACTTVSPIRHELVFAQALTGLLSHHCLAAEIRHQPRNAMRSAGRAGASIDTPCSQGMVVLVGRFRRGVVEVAGGQ